MRNMEFDIKKAPMVRVTWLDARDMETGWLPIKEIREAHKYFEKHIPHYDSLHL